MSTPGHEFNPNNEDLKAFTELASKQFGLEASHPYVIALAEANHRAAVYENALMAAEDTIHQQDKELQVLIYDHKTEVLLYDPALKLGKLLLDDVKRNLNSPESAEPQAPNALMALGVDVEGLHIINNRWGDSTGDAAIGDTANTLIDTADYLKSVFRTRERREAIWRRGEVPRHTDIIARRRKGDELFALIAFHESAEFTRDDMRQMTEDRIKKARRHNGKKLYLHTAIAFYNPETDESVEDLLERADPKTTSRSEQIVRYWRKLGRAATGRY